MLSENTSEYSTTVQNTTPVQTGNLNSQLAICCLDSSQFLVAEEILSNQPLMMLNMPRGNGKANYKVDTLIMVVEELLPNGAQSWAKVAALYQS